MRHTAGRLNCPHSFMTHSLSKNNTPEGRTRIRFVSGFWWFVDPHRSHSICLDPLFWQSGWKVGSLCELLGIGRRTFARAVEESIGITGKAWLRQLRAVAACHLLREGGEIKSLADRLGFRHNTDFANEFKKQVGVSPSYYMKSEQSRSRLL